MFQGPLRGCGAVRCGAVEKGRWMCWEERWENVGMGMERGFGRVSGWDGGCADGVGLVAEVGREEGCVWTCTRIYTSIMINYDNL